MYRYNRHIAGSLCWPFPTIKYKYIFSNKIHGNNFIIQQSENVMIRNYQNENKFILLFVIIFETLSFPLNVATAHPDGLQILCSCATLTTIVHILHLAVCLPTPSASIVSLVNPHSVSAFVKNYIPSM